MLLNLLVYLKDSLSILELINNCGTNVFFLFIAGIKAFGRTETGV